MSNFITTPNMKIPSPIPGADPGPDYANQQFNAMGIIDGHNHSSGSGVQISPNGLNINNALPFQNNPATGLQACTFNEQSSYATINSLWVGTDGNLYFNDGAADPSIQITAGGAVNATSSGISSGTATASFSSSILVVNQASNTPASIKAGSYLMGQTGTSGSNYLSIVPPSSLSGGSYTLTLPAQPAATSFVQIDSSGNITASIAVSGGLTNTNIAAGGVSRPNLVAVGQQISSSVSGNTTSVTPSAVTGLTVTITTSGRPVMVFLQGGTIIAEFSGSAVNNTTPGCSLSLQRNSSTIYTAITFGAASFNSSSCTSLQSGCPAGGFMFLDTPSAGTYTYQVFIAVAFSGTGYTAQVTQTSLAAYEL